MAFDILSIGSIQVLALLDGDGPEKGDPIVESFPGIPAEALLAFREQAPGVYGDHDTWRMRIRAWLVRHPGGVILVDTGIGQPRAPGVEWFGTPGRLHEVLDETGTPSGSIDTVVITHVHDDHIGGTVVFDGKGEPTPAFPDARYVIQRADRDWQFELARTDEEDQVIAAILLEPLERADVLDAIDGDQPLAEGIDLHHLPGHTPGHQVVRIHSDEARAVITADTFNHPIQVGHPEWPSGPDASVSGAAAARRALLAELSSHPGTTIAPAHFAEAFGRIRSGADGLAIWEPA